MGNGVAKLTPCFPAGWRRRRRRDSAAVTSEPFEEGLGHSFCYLRPDPKQLLDHSSHHEPTTTTTFRSISGAALSANTATPLSTSLLLLDDCPSAATFDCSTSFTSIPLQPIPPLSGPLDRAFLSGPLERSFLSGPLDPSLSLFSGPLQKPPPLLRRSLSHGGAALYRHAKALSQALSRSISIKALKPSDGSDQMAGEAAADEPDSFKDSPHKNLQWAQGKAGEDRVHVVVSEDRGWLFVGIYDGFNGPDATDYLLSNLYPAVQTELKGLLWDETSESRHLFVEKKHRSSKKRWKCEWDKERTDLGRTLKEQLQRSSSRARANVNHSEVLKALAMALKRTEEAFLDVADKMVSENPELALMGSCVLAMLMKGEDVYLMNVGDSRAVLGHQAERQELGRINEESLHDLEAFDEGDEMELVPTLSALQLTLDHSTCIEEEVRRIRSEHPEDAGAIMHDRVKGSLKVTRAFGAGFLKQPKWNNALLEMFRIDYVGASPYITCNPFLYHHRLGPKDRFLILSSDGLYQYFTNEEAVAQVELFIATTPEGDPAQHLVEEVLFRAAKKAGMDFHELLEIPHGDRRRYHDDISIIVISFEGRIWRSCM